LTVPQVERFIFLASTRRALAGLGVSIEPLSCPSLNRDGLGFYLNREA